MKPNQLSDEHCRLMGNALGLLYASTPYRNRFYASKVGHPDWDALARHGYAIRKRMSNKQWFYAVTWKGMRAIGLIGQDLRGLEGSELVRVPFWVKMQWGLK